MDPRLHRVLDGELDRDQLPADLRAELERLERATALLAAAPVAGSVAARVLAAVHRPHRALAARVGQWLYERHAVTVKLRPIWSLALAAGLALIAVLTGRGTGPAVLAAGEGIAQFVGRFPGAHRVEVVGSFNDWRPGSLPLTDDDQDGVWNAEVVLPAGEHQYMFVVDGEKWVVDPLAGRYVDDGFGRQNALMIVRPVVR